MARSRRAVAGVLDQAISSATNFLMAALAAAFLAPAEFGRFVVAMSVVVIATGLTRAVVGEPLLAHVSTLDAPERRGAVSDAISAGALLGVLMGVLATVVGFSGLVLLGDLRWLAPWLPVVLIQDAGRLSLLATGRTGTALVLDLVWAAGQAAGLALCVLWRPLDIGVITSTWGIGAAGSAVLFLVMERRVPWSGRPWHWLHRSRHIGAWRALTVLLGQAQQQGVLLTAGLLLTPAVVGGLRAVQLLIAQPVQTFMTALITVLVPSLARLRASGRIAALRRRTRRLAALFATTAASLFLIVPLRERVLAWALPEYVGYATLVLPVVVATWATCANAPHQATLRGLGRTRELFGTQVSAFAIAVAGVVLGAITSDIGILAWSLAVSAVAVAVGNAAQARRALSTHSVENASYEGREKSSANSL